jgi:hypothetical protein
VLLTSLSKARKRWNMEIHYALKITAKRRAARLQAIIPIARRHPPPLRKKNMVQTSLAGQEPPHRKGNKDRGHCCAARIRLALALLVTAARMLLIIANQRSRLVSTAGWLGGLLGSGDRFHATEITGRLGFRRRGSCGPFQDAAHGADRPTFPLATGCATRRSAGAGGSLSIALDTTCAGAARLRATVARDTAREAGSLLLTCSLDF